jgi:hypothetical protein
MAYNMGLELLRAITIASSAASFRAMGESMEVFRVWSLLLKRSSRAL